MSYNPAVHRIKQALFHGAIVDDIESNPIPPPHPELLQYFEPPRKTLKRARKATDTCIEQMKVKPGRRCLRLVARFALIEHFTVPRRVAKVRKDEHVLARDDDDEVLLLDRGSMKVKSESQYPSKLMKGDHDSEDDEELLLKPRTQQKHDLLRDESPDTKIDRGRAPGRIIGSTYPLADFRTNTARGDLVSKAVEDLAWVVQDIVTKPFASRRHKEMIECLQELRAMSIKVSKHTILSCQVMLLTHGLITGRRDRFLEHVSLLHECIKRCTNHHR
jgi:ATP-dependent DNA helicase 2 subunit 2